MTGRRQYTQESVERSLNAAAAEGWIRHWQPDPAQVGVRGRYRVRPVDGPEVILTSVAEAYAFSCGVASAHHAHLRKMAQPQEADVRYHSSDDMPDEMFAPVAVVVQADGSLDVYGCIDIMDRRTAGEVAAAG